VNTPISYNRIHGLDIMRALAICLVVHVHGMPLLNWSGSDEIIGELKLFETISYLPTIELAYLFGGVELFFVLSGFLIGGILIRQLDQQNYHFSITDLMTFWKRRWFRTLPNYYLFLIINILLAYFNFNKNSIESFNWSFITFTHNFNSHFSGFFLESWSLSVEEWFYILFPLCTIVSLKLLPSKRTFLVTTLLFCIAPLVYRIINTDLETPDYYWWDIKYKKVVLMRLDSIMYGVIGAYLFFYHNSIWRKIRLWALIISLGSAIARQYWLNNYFDSSGFFEKTWYFSLTPIICSLLLPYFSTLLLELENTQVPLKKFYSKYLAPVIIHISRISYSMYLVNLSVIFMVIDKKILIDSKLDSIVLYVFYWILVISISTMIFYYFEKPITKLREKTFINLN